jgi:hypothetical protein
MRWQKIEFQEQPMMSETQQRQQLTTKTQFTGCLLCNETNV